MKNLNCIVLLWMLCGFECIPLWGPVTVVVIEGWTSPLLHHRNSTGPSQIGQSPSAWVMGSCLQREPCAGLTSQTNCTSRGIYCHRQKHTAPEQLNYPCFDVFFPQPRLVGELNGGWVTTKLVWSYHWLWTVYFFFFCIDQQYISGIIGSRW